MWRELLGTIINNNPKTKRRIADEIGVLSPRTLDRWVEGTSLPKSSKVIRNLWQAVPQLDQALREAFPEAFKETPQSPEIPSENYRRVVHAASTMSAANRRWTVIGLVTDQMVRHLDPDGWGIAIVFARYVSPTEKVRCHIQLQNSAGSGVWETRQLASQSIELSMQSLTGLVISSCQPRLIQAIVDESSSPPELQFFMHKERIEALAIFPIQRADSVAGALLVCAASKDYFTRIRFQIAGDYAGLFGLAFVDSEFFAIEQER